MNLREYVEYLVSVVRFYNFTADRSDRMTAEMIAEEVKPFPADIWRYGHSAGIGYRKLIVQDRLKLDLLKRTKVISTRRGVFHEALRYECDEALHLEWAATARNVGHQHLPALWFPASNGLIWGQHSDGLYHEFSLCANARAPAMTTSEEWRDALALQTMRGDKVRHDALAVRIGELAKQASIRDAAIKATRAAGTDVGGDAPTMSEARALELVQHELPLAFNDASGTATPVAEQFQDFQAPSSYDAAMDALFAQLNDEEAAA